MCTQKTSEYANRCLEHLRFRVDIERDVIDDLADTILKAFWIIQRHERVENVNESDTKVAIDVVKAVIGSKRCQFLSGTGAFSFAFLLTDSPNPVLDPVA